MKSNLFSRRNVLRGLGVGAALSPFVPILETRADAGALPRRLIAFFSSNGTVGHAWDPGPGLALSPMMASLQPYVNDLLFVNGLRMECAFATTAQAHAPGMNGMFTGTPAIPNGPGGEAAEHGLASGISVDQFVAKRIGKETKFASLELGVAADGGVGDALGFLSFAGPKQPVLPENDPQKVFRRVFADFDPDGGAGTAMQQRLADRRSVIDLVRGDLSVLKDRVGADDRVKMEAHLQAIRDIETSLDLGTGSGANTGCSVPAEPGVSGGDGPAGGLPGAVSNVPAVAKAQIDLLVTAMACDLTRVGSVMIGGGGSGLVYDWLGHTEDHHSLAHAVDNTRLMELNGWIAEQYAYLLSRLAAIPEGDGTMLDNTVVVWLNELAHGNHEYEPMRILLTSGGYFRASRVLRLSGAFDEYNNLLLSLCHAAGLTDVETFGDPAFCTGPLDALL